MMGSGAAAYERLVWQLGFTIVEVCKLQQPLMFLHLGCSCVCSSCLYMLSRPEEQMRETGQMISVLHKSVEWVLWYRGRIARIYLRVQVRTSPDNMTAYVLWDAHDDRLYSAEREISHRCAGLLLCISSANDHQILLQGQTVFLPSFLWLIRMSRR